MKPWLSPESPKKVNEEIEEVATSIATHAHPSQREYVKEAAMVALTTLRNDWEREKEEAAREKLKGLGLSRKMSIAETDFALSLLRKGQPELTMEDIKLHNAEAEGFNLGFEEAMKKAIEALDLEYNK